MKTDTPSLADVVALLESLRADVARLGERVATLEAARVSPATVPAAEEPAAPDDHTMTIIAAAIAAFLGKKAHIRQIQLLGSAAWAQQGRVTIQASHALNSARSQP
jgi:methylmalonyl-CoA carboxyltransferase large subunit